MKRLIKKLLGITELERQLEAVLRHHNIKLEKQPHYKVAEQKQLGFKANGK